MAEDTQLGQIAFAEDVVQARRALALGFKAVLNPNAGPDTIEMAQKSISMGLFVVDEDLMEDLFPAQDTSINLSPRQKEVLGLMAKGLSYAKIAKKLGFSTHNAKYHICDIMGKFDADSRTEAVMKAVRLGLVS